MTPAEPSWTRPAHGVRRILNNAADTAVLRLTRVQTGDLSSADVGDDTA